MRTIGLQEFVRYFHRDVATKRGKFAFVLGAGCSISSKIPGAKALVEKWLPDLVAMKAGPSQNPDAWAMEHLGADFSANPAKYYQPVIHGLFPATADRQQEIESLIDGRDPGFGYATLAQLMAHSDYGPHCRHVLTTNFDDMVSDALYLYTRRRPLVIVHDSLADFISLDNRRPLVVKLHGDARIDPRNTKDETRSLHETMAEALRILASELNLVFIGYGGNDVSVATALKAATAGQRRRNTFWVNSHIPDNDFGAWLNDVGAIHVDHLDFDELMLAIRNQFNLDHPDTGRFEEINRTYYETLGNLSKEVTEKPESTEKVYLTDALASAIHNAKDWWGVELEARKYRESAPKEADALYQAGIAKFSDSPPLLGNYATFLANIRQEYDAAEAMYKRAIEADPNHAINLGSYANFLTDIRHEHDDAEAMYKRAIEADPNNANNLGNHANFLTNIRHDHDAAEAMYRRAIEANPNHANNLGNHANFLTDIRHEHDAAEAMYRRAIEANPNHANNLGNYAELLFLRGRGVEARDYLVRAEHQAPNSEPNLLTVYGYLRYAFSTEEAERTAALAGLAGLALHGVRCLTWKFDQVIERAEADGHPEPALLRVLAAVITEKAPIESLDEFEAWRSASGST